jgi:sugar lactone lactonase YvrE
MRQTIGRIALAAGVAAALAWAVDTRTWTESEAAEFEKGNTTGLALSSRGRLTLAPALATVAEADAAQLWCLAGDAHGHIYAGASDGKVYAVESGGGARLLTKLSGGSIYALALSHDGQLYAAVSPEAKIYRIDAAGNSQVLAALKAHYIWALVPGAMGALYAATGDPGQIVRIGTDGKTSLFFDAGEMHVRSLALDAKGNLVAGTEPGGVVIRVAPSGEGFILHQTGKREVTALAVGSDGTIYAAASGNRSSAGGISAAPVPVTPQVAPTPAQAAPQQPQPTPVPAAAVTVRPSLAAPPVGALAAGTVGGSEIWRIAPDGEPVRLWTSARELVYSLAVDGHGALWAATGNDGRIYRIDSQLESTRLADLEPPQVTALLSSATGAVYAATANPGKVYRLGPGLEKEGRIESDLFDGNGFTYWGRLRWEGEANGGSIQLETRSGNIDRAQKNWSPWAAVDPAQGGRVASPASRYLAWRATLRPSPSGASPVLSLVEVAYQQKNVAPVVEQVELTPPNYKFPSVTATLSSSNNLTLPPIGQVKRPNAPTPVNEPAGTITMNYDKGWRGARWKASDQNGDTLRFKVEIRGVEEKEWKPLKDDLAENRFSWDSTGFADGRYVLRVTASDAPDNYPGQALTCVAESDPFVIDNTPPAVSGLTARIESGKIVLRLHAADSLTPLFSAEYSLDGGPWTAIRPSTGMTDSLAHDYHAEIEKPAGSESAVAVKVTDSDDNVTVQKVIVRP